MRFEGLGGDGGGVGDQDRGAGRGVVDGLERTRCWAARLARALAWTRRWNRTLTEMNGGGWIELALPIRAAASPPGRSRVNRVMPPSLLARSTGSPSSFL
jgi:hypothetical protein